MVDIEDTTKGERIWIVSIFISFIAGVWVIWTTEFNSESIMNHIKLFYSILLFLAISVAINFVLKGKRNKHNKTKNGSE